MLLTLGVAMTAVPKVLLREAEGVQVYTLAPLAVRVTPAVPPQSVGLDALTLILKLLFVFTVKVLMEV